MNRLLSMLVAAAFVVFAFAGVVRAHEGHDHKVLGTVTMAAADHVMLKDQAGKDVTVLVNKTTRIKSTPAMKVEEIKPGTRIVITATMDKTKTMTAKTIEVGASK